MIVELDDVKRFIRITTDDDDVMLTDILGAVDEMVKDLIGFNIESSQDTEYYKGIGEDMLLTRRYPITAVASIYDDPDRSFGADTLISSSGYYISDEIPGAIILKDTIFNGCDRENVKITYTAGYTPSTMPKDLKLAVCKLVYADYLELQGAINAVEGTEDRIEKLRDNAKEVVRKYAFLR